MIKDTESRGRVANTTASYSGELGFKSRRGDRLSWLEFFVVSLSPSRQIPGYYLKLDHDRFLHNLPIIYLSTFYATLYSPSYWECVVEKL
jgi:hypothetical protein